MTSSRSSGRARLLGAREGGSGKADWLWRTTGEGFACEDDFRSDHRLSLVGTNAFGTPCFPLTVRALGRFGGFAENAADASRLLSLGCAAQSSSSSEDGVNARDLSLFIPRKPGGGEFDFFRDDVFMEGGSVLEDVSSNKTLKLRPLLRGFMGVSAMIVSFGSGPPSPG